MPCARAKRGSACCSMVAGRDDDVARLREVHFGQSGGVGDVRAKDARSLPSWAVDISPERQPDGSLSADKIREVTETACARVPYSSNGRTGG